MRPIVRRDCDATYPDSFVPAFTVKRENRLPDFGLFVVIAAFAFVLLYAIGGSGNAPMSTVLAAMRVSPIAPLRGLATFYVETGVVAIDAAGRTFSVSELQGSCDPEVDYHCRYRQVAEPIPLAVAIGEEWVPALRYRRLPKRALWMLTPFLAPLFMVRAAGREGGRAVVVRTNHQDGRVVVQQGRNGSPRGVSSRGMLSSSPPV